MLTAGGGATWLEVSWPIEGTRRLLVRVTWEGQKSYFLGRET